MAPLSGTTCYRIVTTDPDVHLGTFWRIELGIWCECVIECKHISVYVIQKSILTLKNVCATNGCYVDDIERSLTCPEFQNFARNVQNFFLNIRNVHLFFFKVCSLKQCRLQRYSLLFFIFVSVFVVFNMELFTLPVSPIEPNSALCLLFFFFCSF